MKLYHMQSWIPYIDVQWYHCERVKKHGFFKLKCFAGVSYWSGSIFYCSKLLSSSCFNRHELFRSPATIAWHGKWYGSNATE
eukprot:UN09752